MDLSEQIETVQLHVRSLISRIEDVKCPNKRQLAQLGALMLWCDKLAERCEDIGRGER